MRESTFGILMLTRGALYVFTNPTIKKPSLRLHINLLHCEKIKCQEKYLLLTLPPLRVKSKDMKNNDEGDSNYNYSLLPLPLPGMTITTPENENAVKAVDSLDEAEMENAKEGESANPAQEDEENIEHFDSKGRNEKEDNRKSDNGLTEEAFMKDERKDKKKNKNKKDKNLAQVTLLINSKSYSTYLYKWIYRIIKTNLWRVTNVVMPILQSKGIITRQLPDNRVKHSLKRRAVFLAHYCFGSGEQLECADYFQAKWDGEPNLVIGPTFHPGGYAVPFGCAVGFEASLSTLVMKNARFKYFSAFISAALNSAQTLKTIGLTDYLRGKSFPIKFVNVKRTIVDEWILLNCCSDMVKSFVEATDDLPDPVRALTIGRHSYNKDDAADVFKAISERKNLKKMSHLTFSALNFNNFPQSSFSSLCSSLENLEDLELSRINIDGSLIFEAACRDAPNIRKLYLCGLKFEHEWTNEKLKLPATLALLNISETYFSGPSFANFLQNITLKEAKVPFFFVANSLQFSESAFADYKSHINFDQCASNILELDMSDNMIPRISFELIFDFIATQKRLRNVLFNNIVTDDQHNFVHKLSFVHPGPSFAGIDFSGQFRTIIIQQFISSVPSSSSLRRLCMKGCHAGNKGFELIQNLLNLLKQLNEIEIDGFQPEIIPHNKRIEGQRHPLIQCWKKIMHHRFISGNDLPISDMAILGFVIEKELNETKDGKIYRFDERLCKDDIEMFNAISPPNRAKPSTLQNRLDYLTQSMKNGNEEGIKRAISPDIFLILNKKIPLDQEIEKRPLKEAPTDVDNAFDDDADVNFSDISSNDDSMDDPFKDDNEFDDSQDPFDEIYVPKSTTSIKLADDKGNNVPKVKKNEKSRKDKISKNNNKAKKPKSSNNSKLAPKSVGKNKNADKNKESDIKNKKSDVENKESDVKNKKSDIKNKKSDVKNKKSDVKNKKSDVKNKKSDVKNKKSDVKNEKDDVKNEKNDVKNEKNDVKSIKSDTKSKSEPKSNELTKKKK